MAPSTKWSAFAAVLCLSLAVIVTSVRSDVERHSGDRATIVDKHGEFEALGATTANTMRTLDTLQEAIRDRMKEMSQQSGRGLDAAIEFWWKQGIKEDGQCGTYMIKDCFLRAMKLLQTVTPAEVDVVWSAMEKVWLTDKITRATFHETIEPKDMPPTRTALVTKFFQQELTGGAAAENDVQEGALGEAMYNVIMKYSLSGKVDLAAFLKYYRTLSALIDHDGYFELMFRNAWHWIGGEGASENTSNLRVLVTYNDQTEKVVALKHDMGVAHNANAIAAQLVKEGQIVMEEVYSVTW